LNKRFFQAACVTVFSAQQQERAAAEQEQEGG